MEENSMYNKLLLLPLFQGLCKEDFTAILEKVKLHFQKLPAGSCIVRQNNACEGLFLSCKAKYSQNQQTKPIIIHSTKHWKHRM